MLPAAYDHHLAHRLAGDSQPFEDFLLITDVADEIDHVALLDDVQAAGNDELVVAHDGRDDDAQILADLGAQVDELAAQDGAAFGQVDADEPDLALRELVDLHRPRHGHEPENRVDDLFVGVDDLGDIRPFAGQQVLVIRIHLATDAGELGDILVEHVGKEAGQQVDLIGVGHGQQDVGLHDARVLQHARAAARPLDGLHVRGFRHLAQRLVRSVDDHDFLVLDSQPL